MIGIVDLQMSNLRSVANAVASVGYDARLVRSPDELEGLTHLVLPGVGSFRVAMEHMAAQGLVEPLRARARGGTPLLGICLGMQLLGDSGDEGGFGPGLGLLAGHVQRFDPARVPAIPHVGWNDVHFARKHPVFERVKNRADFYFVHSYHLVCERPEDLLGTVGYGAAPTASDAFEPRYAAVVARDNVLGCQFHPEKSQLNGLRILENFCAWNGRDPGSARC